MNPRTTWWLTAVAVGLFCYIYFVDLRGRATNERRPAQLLPDFDPAKVSSIEITRTNQTIRAELKNDRWQLSAPVYPAQGTAIESFLNALTKLNRLNEIQAQEIDSASGGLTPFGLNPASATVRLNCGTNVVQFRVGSKTLLGDRVYVQPMGASGVFTTEASLLEHLPSSTNAWRNPLLIHQGSLTCDRIAITAGSRSLQLERDGTTQLWRLTRPMTLRADSARVEALLQQLRVARVSQFITDDPTQDLEPFGLAQPEAELVLASGSNTVFQVQFGRSSTNDPSQVYARRLSHTNVVLIPRDLADLTGQPYTVFRDQTLLSFRPGAVDRIEAQADEAFAVQRQGQDAWEIVEPFRAPADRQLMRLFLGDLAKVQIVAFEKDVVADFMPYGLDKPKRRYILKKSVPSGATATNQTIVQIDFGANPVNEPDKVFCRRSDETSVYVVPFADMLRLEGAAFALRDRRVWTFASSNVVRVAIVQRGQKFELVRDVATRRWDKENNVRNAGIEETLHRLGELQADSWRARGEHHAKLLGTADSKYHVSIYVQEAGKSRPPLELAFGNLASNGQPYASVVLEQGEPVIFKFPVALYALVAEYLSVPATTSEL